LLVEEVEDDRPDDHTDSKTSSSGPQLKDEAPLLLNPDLPDLKAVLEKADVVMHVLDARDPTSYRLPHVENFAKANGRTKLVFILSKIGTHHFIYPEVVSYLSCQTSSHRKR
jgi:hypothetical protein